jgi:hypothetical protein
MANNHFLRKMASDELIDTLFFSTGSVVTKTRTPDTTTLSVPNVTVVIRHNRNIKINGELHKSIHEAKLKLQRMI